MHSSRGLLKILSPTHMASTAPLASAATAMSIKALGGVPRVTNARLDNVKPKVVFFFAMMANISRAHACFQARCLSQQAAFFSLALGSVPQSRESLATGDRKI
jgi:hypothetical protein